MKRLALSLILILVLVSPALSGCITTRTPDGTTTTKADIQTTIALTQLALQTAEQAWQFWQTNHKEATAEQIATELAKREAQMQLLRDAITALGLQLKDAK